MTKWLEQGLKYLQEPLLRFCHNFTARRLIWGVVFFWATAFLLGFEALPGRPALEVGQPSPKDFLSPQSITYESEVLTRQAREEAARRVEPLYRVDNQALAANEKELERLLQGVEEATARAGPAQAAAALRTFLGDAVSLDEASKALAAGEEARRSLGEKLREKLRTALGRGVGEAGLDATRALLLQEVAEMEVPAALKPLARALLTRLPLTPTLVYDLEGTQLRVQEAQARVQPVQVTIRAEEKIVGKGELVTAQDIEALQQLGLLRPPAALFSFLGILILVGLLYLLLAFYLLAYQREVLERESHLILLGVLLILGVGLGRVVTAIELGGRPEMASQVGYMVPVAASAMLIAILLDSRLAVFCTVLLGLLVGILSGGQFSFVAVAVVGGLAGIYSVSHLSQRTDLAKASLYIILADMAAIGGIGLIQGSAASVLAVGLLMGLANGVFSSVLTIGSLPFLESAFGITSAAKLLELANPNQPLLRRLLLEAPGTYHHSLLVANLAEAAADALGADALLARVASFYHDIGKLRRPYFFIENQLTAENPHDKLTPSLSTLIITAHIKDGLEMAREAKLPPVIRDVIAQHHGSSLVTYFYHKATAEGRGEAVPEAEFRYDSPKPRSKEAAIVMLADSVEASARSLQKPTPARLEGLVRRIIREKLEDGQLDECALTFQELDKIALAFTRSLSGIFHSRIEYPEAVLKEMERRKVRDAPARKQSTG